MIIDSLKRDTFYSSTCKMQTTHMFCCSDKKLTYSFAVVNSIAAITRVAIKNSSGKFFEKNIFEIKLVSNSEG